jgi:hypothetical protein
MGGTGIPYLLLQYLIIETFRLIGVFRRRPQPALPFDGERREVGEDVEFVLVEENLFVRIIAVHAGIITSQDQKIITSLIKPPPNSAGDVQLF